MTLLDAERDAPRVTRNPFVGPRALHAGEGLFGRDREVVELTDLLIAERIVLLYSPSGAGKTSLLAAGVVPQLEREGFRVLPTIRVGHEPGSASGEGTANRYVLSTLLSLEEGLSRDAQHRLDELGATSLRDYLRPILEEGQADDGHVAEDAPDVVLVFDQFEEILTLDPTDQAAKAAFFGQIGAALAHRRLWALFAMREDYVAGLDPYLPVVPTRCRTRYRLDFLGVDAARQAIQRPAAAVGLTVSDEAAGRLVDDLRRVRVQRPEGVVEELGPYVEPVQLQVVCRRLFQHLPPGATGIEVGDLDQVRDVDDALADYYEETVADVAAKSGVSERQIRDLCEGQLITKQGFRGQVLPSSAATGAAEHRVLELLERAHLVRSETRRGAIWYELAHDRLIQPLRDSNAAWRERNFSVLQRQAELWDSEHRSGGLLLADGALEEAEAWADRHPDDLTETDREFLEACRQARAEAEREQRRTRVIRRLAVAACIVSIVAVVFAVTSIVSLRRANTSETRERQQSLLNAYRGQLTIDSADSLRAALKAYDAMPNAAAEAAVRTALDADNARRVLQANHGLVVASEFDSDGRRILTAGLDGTAKLFDTATGRRLRTFGNGSAGRRPPLTGASFSPDGSMVVTAAMDGEVHVYEAASGGHVARLDNYSARGFAQWGRLRGRNVVLASSPFGSPALWDPTKPTRPIARYNTRSGGGTDLSRDGRYVVTGRSTGFVEVWEAESGRLVARSPRFGATATLPRFVTPTSTRVATLAATAGSGWRVVFWDWHRTGSVQRTMWQGHQPPELAVSRDGDRVAAGLDGRAVVLDATSGRQVGGTPEGEDEVQALDFSSDGRWLATAGADGSVRVWAATRRSSRPIGELLGHRGAVSTVRFHPRDARVVVTAGNDGTARTWQLPLPIVQSGGSSRISDSDLSPDGRYLVTAEDDGWLRVRRSDTGGLEAEHRQEDGVIACPADPCKISVAFTPDGTEVVATQFGGNPVVWRWRGRDAPRRLQGKVALITQISMSPDGETVAAGTRLNQVVFWELKTGRLMGQVTAGPPEYVVSDLALVPGSPLIAIGSSDGTVGIWDRGHPDEPVRTLRKPVEPGVQALDVTRDGRYLAAAAEDRTLRVWRISDGRLEQTISRLNSRVGDLAFNADGSLLAVGTGDAAVRVWRWSDENELAVLRRHGDAVNSVEFSPDGRRLVSASDDSAVAAYSCTTCQPFGQVLREAKRLERVNRRSR